MMVAKASTASSASNRPIDARDAAALGSLCQHQWRIRKTFIELESAEGKEKIIDQGFHSDNEVSLSEKKSSDVESGSSKAEEIAKLADWHKIWKSSSKGSGSAGGSSKRPSGADELGANAAQIALAHKTWFSSSESQSLQQDSDDSFAKGEKSEDEFDLQYAVALHKELQGLVDSGVDVRDAIEMRYPSLNLRKVVPRGLDGEMLSIGSALHLLEPNGQQCKACGCHRRGKCYRHETCLYCHFHHSRRDCRITGKTRKSQTSGAKERRERRKRCEARVAKSMRDPANDSDCGSDEASDGEGGNERPPEASAGYFQQQRKPHSQRKREQFEKAFEECEVEEADNPPLPNLKPGQIISL